MEPRPLFIAEISANHNGDFNRALDLIEAAAMAGARAVKFQTYKPETMTLPLDRFRVSDGHTLWGGSSLFELYRQAMTPWEWHQDLFSRCRELEVVPFSSPFDKTAVDLLESLDCPIYKIASLETGDLDLISYVAQTGKPIIMSTGATLLREIMEAVDAALENGCSDLTLLVCTSSYPSDPKDSHVNRIKFLKKSFGVKVGLSDHTLGIGVAIASVVLGATAIEKHFTLSRAEGGPDASFSMEPNEFRDMVQECHVALTSLGEETWKITDAEEESRRLRRSLYIAKDVVKGQVADRDNIRCLRPNQGGEIRNLPAIVGKKFRQDFPAGSAATLDCVE